MAAYLYTKAIDEAGRSGRSAANAPPPGPITPTSPVRAVEPAPSPAPSAPPPAPTAPPPAPAAAPPPATPARPPEPAAPSPLEARAPIRNVIQDYADAYSRLDSSAVKRVFPSINERALASGFSGLKSQIVHVLNEQFQSLTDSEATVSCTWDVNFVPKVGGQQHDTRTITLRLQKTNSGWVIVDRR
jgi:hypothetical protein